MKKILVVTDSNSGIKIEEGKKLGIEIVLMPFFINGKEYLEEITLTQDEFYQFLENDANISTSQPSNYSLYTLFENALNEYEDIIYIPMTSGLSGSCNTAKLIAAEFNGRVHVIDNLRISVTQKEAVLEVLTMCKQEYSVSEIIDYLEKSKKNASIYIYLDTLKYLKKGGRITPAAALLANILGIRPVLYSRGGNLDTLAKCRSLGQAKKRMIRQLKEELNGEFKEYYLKGQATISIAHTQNYEEALKFKAEIQAEIPNIPFRFIDSLSLSVSCHTGPKTLACAIAVNAFLENEENLTTVFAK